MKLSHKKIRGFTLIEILVVLSIISLLSSIVMATLNSSRAKARDARRASDMHQIVLALNLFYSENGCLPTTSGSSCPGAIGYSGADPGAGGWDVSSLGGFMTFLKNGNFMPNDPSDPVNNINAWGDSGYGYRYYCYSDGPTLYYFKEGNGREWTSALNHDSNYLCK